MTNQKWVGWSYSLCNTYTWYKKKNQRKENEIIHIFNI